MFDQDKMLGYFKTLFFETYNERPCYLCTMCETTALWIKLTMKDEA